MTTGTFLSTVVRFCPVKGQKLEKKFEARDRRLLESAIMLRTSTLEINVERPNLSNRVIGIINFVKHFLKFIVDTMN